LSLSVQLADRRGAFLLDAEFTTGAGVTALFGRSGAGKSSIVQMIAGIRQPQGGRIALNGRTLFDPAAAIDLPARQRNVGLVFQEPRLFPHLSVRANLLYGRWASGISSHAGRIRFQAVKRSGSQSAVRCWPVRKSCSWTSPCRSSTGRGAPKSCRFSIGLRMEAACRSCT